MNVAQKSNWPEFKIFSDEICLLPQKERMREEGDFFVPYT